MALLIVRLCCRRAGGPAGGETGWLFHLKVNLCVRARSLYLQSCWYKEPCVEQWCDVWICLSRGCQLCLGERVCGCVHMCRAGDRLEGERWVWGEDCERRSDLRLIWTWSQTEGSSLWRQGASLPLVPCLDDCDAMSHLWLYNLIYFYIFSYYFQHAGKFVEVCVLLLALMFGVQK